MEEIAVNLPHTTWCRAYSNWQPPYEDCTCGAEGAVFEPGDWIMYRLPHSSAKYMGAVLATNADGVYLHSMADDLPGATFIVRWPQIIEVRKRSTK